METRLAKLDDGNIEVTTEVKKIINKEQLMNQRSFFEKEIVKIDELLKQFDPPIEQPKAI